MAKFAVERNINVDQWEAVSVVEAIGPKAAVDNVADVAGVYGVREEGSSEARHLYRRHGDGSLDLIEAI